MHQQKSDFWEGMMIGPITSTPCRRVRQGLMSGLLGSCAILLPVAAQAQQAPGEAPQVQDIVVTASRYQQTLQTTPLAVSAISGDALQSRGVVEVANLSTEVPNLQIGTNGANASVDISVRGITANNTAFYSGNPAVAPYVNGVYVPRTQGLNEALFDIERVEVLRGPQGTLYGRNSTAGALNIITAKPTQTFGYSADLSYGNYNTVISHAIVNAPLTDTLAVRAVFFSDRDDGLQNTHGATRGNYDRADQFGGRLSALWKPSSSFTALIETDMFRENGSPNLGVATPVPGTVYPTSLISNPYSPAVTPGQDGLENIHVLNLRANLDYRFDDHLSLSYIGGYGTVRLHTFTDDDGAATAFATADFQEHEWNTGHEVDLHYISDRLKMVVGGNFTYEHDNGDLAVAFPLATGFAPRQLQFPHFDYAQRSYGAFGQATYSLTSSLRVTGGVRYSHDYTQNPGAGTLFCNAGTPNFAPITSTNCTRFSAFNQAARTFSHVNWKAGVDWDIGPRSLLYGSVSTGYKQGALNSASALLTTPVVQPETVTNFEIGSKNRLFGGAVTLNLALFYMRYQNLQVQQVVFVTTNPPVTANVTTNAAKASIYGAEIEGAWRITSDDQLSGFVSYLHARYDQFLNANDPITDPNNLQPLNLSGNRLIRSPDFTARANYSHDFHFAGGGRLTPQVSFFYQTQSYLREFNKGFDRQPGYTRTDLRLTYETAGKHWTFEGFVTNLENRAVRVAEYAASSYLQSFYAPPRRYGLRAAFKY
jgi:iron complex outermembrane receptor protein